MLSRSALSKGVQHAARRSGAVSRRGFAAAASGSASIPSGSYETADISGLKVASKDAHGPTTTLAVVAKAGTRYQPLPGLTFGLEQYAFKTTQRRSALRINREAELLGGQLTASHTREALVIEASFLRDDLPYFAELLAEVVSQTKYTTHEFHEEIERILPFKKAAVHADVAGLALDNAHAVAFHNGLGAALNPSASFPFQKYVNEEYISSFADVVYSKPNIAVVADGAGAQNLSKWVDQFFKSVPAAARSGQTLKSEPTKYYGGEQRTSHPAGNAVVIAFPGSDTAGSKPEIEVLATLLGGQSTIKWTTGFSLLAKATAGTSGLSATASNQAYSDAGLLTIQLSGAAPSVRKAAEETVKALKAIAAGNVSKEDVAKAVANAKFGLFEKAQTRGAGVLLAGTSLVHSGKVQDLAGLAKSLDAVTADKLKTTAKSLLDGKATVSTVGDLFVLPYAEELGLRV